MTLYAISPTQDDVFTALRAVLTQVLPAGTEIVAGQANRTPEPKAANFVIFTETARRRIETNSNGYVDSKFTGSVAADVLTVSAITAGESVGIGNQLFGPGVAANTKILDQITGAPGGIGTYHVSPAQTVASATLSCGVETVLAPTEVTVQLDFHGPGDTSQPNDNAQAVMSIFRDDIGYQLFKAQNANVSPLYADDMGQIPFINGEGQYEDRQVLKIMLQVNPTLSVPREFADTAKVRTVEVETTYPL